MEKSEVNLWTSYRKNDNESSTQKKPQSFYEQGKEGLHR